MIDTCFVFSLVREKPARIISPGGGILADEMGLGKTVEVLACVLLHPRDGLPKLEPLPVLEGVELAENMEVGIEKTIYDNSI